MKRIYLLLSAFIVLSFMYVAGEHFTELYQHTYLPRPTIAVAVNRWYTLDGLGRPSQTVDCGITPDGKDLISLQEYDDQGRKLRTWLPAKSAGNGNYMTLFLTKWCKLISRR